MDPFTVLPLGYRCIKQRCLIVWITGVMPDWQANGKPTRQTSIITGDEAAGSRGHGSRMMFGRQLAEALEADDHLLDGRGIAGGHGTGWSMLFGATHAPSAIRSSSSSTRAEIESATGIAQWLGITRFMNWFTSRQRSPR